MTDQMIPADEVREIAARFRNQVQLHVPAAECRVWERAAEAVEALLPPPTLADMTAEEREACQWMQADHAQGDRVVILDGTPDHDGLVRVLEKSLAAYSPHPDDVTPRPDLPRMTWPGTEKPAPAPAPALPEGWRLADHREYGRVIVTNPTPGSSGGIYCVASSDWDSTGFDWHYCPHDELTFLNDQGADQ